VVFLETEQITPEVLEQRPELVQHLDAWWAGGLTQLLSSSACH